MTSNNESELFDRCMAYAVERNAKEKKRLANRIRKWVNGNKHSKMCFQAAANYQGYHREKKYTPICFLLTRHGPLDLVELLIKHAPETLKTKTYDEDLLPIHLAIIWGAPLEIVQVLIKGFPESIRVTDPVGCLPLHEACYGESSIEVVRYLVEVFPRSLRIIDRSNGQLPLQWACCVRRVSPELLNFLIEAYPKSIRESDFHGFLPLHTACRASVISLESIRALIKAHPESVMEKDNDDALPLHCACGKDAIFEGAEVASLDLLTALVQAYPEGLQIADNNGFLPLHYACLRNASLGELNFLVEAFPSSIDARTKCFLIPSSYLRRGYGALNLHEACAGGYSAHLVNLLLRAQTFPSTENFMERDANGRIPLHHACTNPDIAYSVDITRALLDADPSDCSTMVTDNQGKTPL